MKTKFIDFWTRNPLLKLISLGVAFILWLVVVNYDDPTISKSYSSIPVELTNTQVITDAGQVFEIAEGSDTVSVSVKAKRSIHNSLSRDDFKATADLSRIDSEGNAPVEVRAAKYSDRIDSISVKGKSSILVEIENLMERQLNIQVETEGELGEEYMVGSVSLDKNVVKISGPESKVNEVALAKSVVDIGGMTQDISTSEDIFLYDEEGGVIEHSDITMSRTSVGIKVSLWKKKTVPVTYGYMGEPADGYGLTGVLRCEPESVDIAGTPSVVDSTTSLVIPSSAVDISGATSDKSVTVSAKDYLAGGLSLLRGDEGSQIVITVGISALGAKTVEVPVSNIKAINVPEGMHATVGGLGDVVAVQVRGLGNAFAQLDPLAITGTIDVDGLSLADEGESIQPGAYDAAVTFNYPEGITDGGNFVTAQLILRHESDVETGDE